MTRTLQEIFDSLPPDRRALIERRVRELMQATGKARPPKRTGDE